MAKVQAEVANARLSRAFDEVDNEARRNLLIEVLDLKTARAFYAMRFAELGDQERVVELKILWAAMKQAVGDTRKESLFARIEAALATLASA